ncbi:MAG: alanine--tRNA ligase [Oscillospiraceae bacterium]|jgi:alanyl-tRNA synthetase|nr:alanine--tRNA ligase [Oscillospiraceae bacterium]
MKWTGLNELREKYLSFFESKGHLRLPSFPLIPQNDNSLLLINSGMAPMKKYFTGEITPPRKRVTTCQKCIRTPDIERVGITARHGTYFEMLGNFSFGDYFKHEATKWAWEFCIDVLELPADRIWVSVYEQDDEAVEIWTKEVGVDPSRIVRLGKEDNFWEHGAGPCGPCSELYFDRGEQYGCDSPTCGVGCDCDRYVEFWNNVFTQFSNDGNNNYTPLDHPNIDTGMGLERLACIMQGVDNLFLVDTVQKIMKHIIDISGVAYGSSPKTDISLRVITDHIRSTTFMIGDGVMPSNEGRGYVLRRLLRRAARHGRLLGVTHTFLSEVCDTVIEENKSAYPELAEKRDFIKKLIGVEEESFAKTIDQGLQLLESYINSETKELSGEAAFKLNDTYGFPIDLTVEILAEKGISVDTEGYHALMKEQKTRARNARKNAGADAWEGKGNVLENIPATEFVGYGNTLAGAEVLALLQDGERVKIAQGGSEAIAILNQSSFYAESGGQVGDIGIFESDKAIIKVLDTTKNHSGLFLHKILIEAGELSEGDTVTAKVDFEARAATERNHTAAHLLQAALRQVLGTHVEQAGQLVSPKGVRFDFTHFSALTEHELASVEYAVNLEILQSIDVFTKEMPIDEAKKLGAMALFGEKYGDVVRVVKVDDFSIELCGGTHISNTARLGLFKIVSEASVASGVRRIEAVTGEGVLELLDSTLKTVKDSAAAMKLNNPSELVRRSVQLSTELKDKDKEIEKLNARLANMQIESKLANAAEVNGLRLVKGIFKDTTPDALRQMCDRIKDTMPDGVAVLACTNGDKGNICVAVGKEALTKGAHAGNIIREVAALAGGKGGGRPDSAMAGIKELDKLEGAMDSVEEILKK